MLCYGIDLSVTTTIVININHRWQKETNEFNNMAYISFPESSRDRLVDIFALGVNLVSHK